MSPKTHWIVRGIALLVILACAVKCGGKEVLVINVPARPPTDGSSHRLTAQELEEQRHPAPVAPGNLDGYFQAYQWWVR